MSMASVLFRRGNGTAEAVQWGLREIWGWKCLQSARQLLAMVARARREVVTRIVAYGLGRRWMVVEV